MTLVTELLQYVKANTWWSLKYKKHMELIPVWDIDPVPYGFYYVQYDPNINGIYTIVEKTQ